MFSFASDNSQYSKNKNLKLFVNIRCAKPRFVLAFLLVLSFFSVFSQNQHFPNIIFGKPVVYKTPVFHEDSLLNLPQTRAFRFAYPFKTNINVLQTASRFVIDSIEYYSMFIASEHAYSLNIIFNTFSLNETGTLYISNSDNSFICGPLTKENTQANSMYASPVFEGDTLILLYFDSLNSPIKSQLIISQISHDFTGIIKNSNGTNGNAAECNINVNCTQGADWQEVKNSVCRLSIGGTTLCTGTLINNTMQDGTPYVITANHCLDSELDASTTVFYFNYEASDCDGTIGLLNNYVSGASLRATSPTDKEDFTLLEMNSKPPVDFNVYYAGWNNLNDHSAGSTSIHHPRGDIKKISFDADAPISTTFLSYAFNSHLLISDWEYGTTESGSSGGALFNSDKQLIGVLSGGEAECGNSVNDYFCKFSVAFSKYTLKQNQLAFWLDPTGSGVTSINGYDPNYIPANKISNIYSNDSVYVSDFGLYAQGFFCGLNQLEWTSLAESFQKQTNKTLYAISAKVNLSENFQSENVKVNIYSTRLHSDSLIFSQALADSNIVDSTLLFIELTDPLFLASNFYVEFSTTIPDSNFVLLNSNKDGGANSTVYVKKNNEWINTTEFGINSSLAIQLYVTNTIDTIIKPIVKESPIFNDRVSKQLYSIFSYELFAKDSLGAFYDTTKYYSISSLNNISDWGGPNEIEANCYTNKFNLASELWLRAVKISVGAIPNNQLQTEIVIFDDSNNKVYSQLIDNSILKENYFNTYNFSEPIFVYNDFKIGICFDSIPEQGISLHQSYDKSFYTESYLKKDNSWMSFEYFKIDYVFAIQPIICFSKYFFTKDTATFAYYKNMQIFDLELKNDYAISVKQKTEDIAVIYLNKNYFETIEVVCYNVLGNIQFVENAVFNNGYYTFNLNNISAGVYVLKIMLDQEEVLIKFVVDL